MTHNPNSQTLRLQCPLAQSRQQLQQLQPNGQPLRAVDFPGADDNAAEEVVRSCEERPQWPGLLCTVAED